MVGRLAVNCTKKVMDICTFDTVKKGTLVLCFLSFRCQRLRMGKRRATFNSNVFISLLRRSRNSEFIVLKNFVIIF